MKLQISILARYGSLVLLCCLLQSVRAQTLQIGESASNFQLTNVRTGQPFQLSDLEGSIVVLDFFFYW